MVTENVVCAYKTIKEVTIMKSGRASYRVSIGLLAMLCAAQNILAQSGYPHIPPCGGSGGHGAQTSCWSYATARAFGRTWSDSRCPAGTYNKEQTINTQLFEPRSFDYSDVRAGDIVGFGPFASPSHVSYVTSVVHPYATDIYVNQVENEISTTEQTGLTLSNVINGAAGVTPRGNPTSLYRKRPLWSIRLRNSFEGGSVGIASAGGTVSEYPTPKIVEERHWESSINGVAVMDGRVFEGYVRRFRSWTSTHAQYGTSSAMLQVRSLSYSTPTDFTANLFREFSVTFQNSFLGASGGQIMINQTTYSAPHGTVVVEDVGSISAQAVYNEINRIQYTFAQWNDGNTTNPRTFAVTDHITFTAYYNAKPLHPANIAAGGAVGSNVCVTWQIHPSDGVTQYQIWRKVKHQNQGTFTPPTLLATLPRTTTQFIDYDYVVTDGYTHDLVSYDVRSYFSLNSTYSDENWIAVFGDGSVVPKTAATQFKPTEWHLGNSPNPFNPSTRVTYSLVEEGAVSLTVYDVQGRQVSSLDQAYREAGYYSATWDGRNQHGSPVGSGVYFANMHVTSSTGKVLYSWTVKLLLTK
jgi:hypothetical protein